MLADLQAHVDARRDWYDTPLDQLWSVYERWLDGERRAFARATVTGQLAAGAMGGSKEYFDSVIRQGEGLAVPNPFTRVDGSVAAALPTPQQPYPVAPGVAAGVLEALGLGLLAGPCWSSWAASREGLPLCRICGRLEAAAGVG
ncbi:hypothetical protein Dcar01_03528 [Deinococcus carri]|uniref:Uncharacterized protein n=1 Tax=Deinococcus carri TaxID=1211323 RepID=A0ABP9WBR8_9DEIO